MKINWKEPKEMFGWGIMMLIVGVLLWGLHMAMDTQAKARIYAAYAQGFNDGTEAMQLEAVDKGLGAWSVITTNGTPGKMGKPGKPDISFTWWQFIGPPTPTNVITTGKIKP